MKQTKNILHTYYCADPDCQTVDYLRLSTQVGYNNSNNNKLNNTHTKENRQERKAWVLFIEGLYSYSPAIITGSPSGLSLVLIYYCDLDTFGMKTSMGGACNGQFGLGGGSLTNSPHSL